MPAAGAPAGTVTIVVGDAVTDELLVLVREASGAGTGHGRVLLVPAEIDDPALIACIGAGAGGVVPRAEATPERLVAAVTQVAGSGGVLSPRMVGRLFDQVARLQNQVLAPRGVGPTGLSDRETEVLRLVAQGFEVKEIAEKLAYSERTIKRVTHDVLNRFQLRNRAHAIAFALEGGLI
ncbi:response regulator transcription factor [Amycolatopsis sp. lyj-23]|uniref:helix-turn-helix transcriptional regulator n=1 Tax=Amycolatopsis sp. lyj-23 TaxID=2789283 RepID=UPI00397CBC51